MTISSFSEQAELHAFLSSHFQPAAILLILLFFFFFFLSQRGARAAKQRESVFERVEMPSVRVPCAQVCLPPPLKRAKMPSLSVFLFSFMEQVAGSKLKRGNKSKTFCIGATR